MLNKNVESIKEWLSLLPVDSNTQMLDSSNAVSLLKQELHRVAINHKLDPKQVTAFQLIYGLSVPRLDINKIKIKTGFSRQDCLDAVDNVVMCLTNNRTLIDFVRVHLPSREYADSNPFPTAVKEPI